MSHQIQAPQATHKCLLLVVEKHKCYSENGVKQQLVLLLNLLDICNILLYKELQGFSVL